MTGAARSSVAIAHVRTTQSRRFAGDSRRRARYANLPFEAPTRARTCISFINMRLEQHLCRRTVTHGRPGANRWLTALRGVAS